LFTSLAPPIDGAFDALVARIAPRVESALPASVHAVRLEAPL